MALMLCIGTGGALSSETLPPALARRGNPTGATCQIRCAPERRRDAPDDEDTAPTAFAIVLNALQQEFGFNISELSMVLQVSRPTVYSWIRGDAEPRGGSLQRIADLQALVEDFGLTSSQPIRRVVQGRPIERKTLIGLLTSKEEIPAHEVIALLRDLAVSTARRPLGLRERRSSRRSAEARQRTFSEETGA